jgi:hypothetical protein
MVDRLLRHKPSRRDKSATIADIAPDFCRTTFELRRSIFAANRGEANGYVTSHVGHALPRRP